MDMNQDNLMAASDGWVVHLTYGIGEIKEVETRSIAGEERRYYRVETRNSTFWMPVDTAENERVRPLASLSRIKRALRVLEQAPMKMASNHKERRKRIRENALDGSLRSDVRLIRDLYARQHQQGLNDTELESLQRMKARFLEEWALRAGIPVNEARKEIDSLLQENLHIKEEEE